jgi:small subunit ribosomal protein S17
MSDSNIETADDTTAHTAADIAADTTTDTTADTTADTGERSARKVRDGVVVSDAMDKTAVVAVVDRVRHPRYNKFVQRSKKLYCHDEANDANVGDRVRVMETRPLSKNKRWRIVEVLERAK